jgi:hypothetical protein
VPAGLTDDQIVDWLNRTRDRSEPVTIGYHMPAGFAAYLRILHPAQNSGDGSYDDVTWQEIAQATGRELTPLSTSDDIWAPDLDLSPPSQWLSDKQCEALSAALNQHTSTPSQCTFLFHSSWAEMVPSGEGVSTIWLPDSDYAVVRGPCSQTRNFSVDPEMWWPADMAWVALTVIDSEDSYVGCSHAAAEAILSHPQIEAVQVSRADAWPRRRD